MIFVVAVSGLVFVGFVHAESTAAVGRTGRVTSASPATAPSASKSDDEKVEYKTVTGQISGVNAGFIAVEYQRDLAKGSAAEMAFPIDEAAKAQLKNILKALKLGDTVTVEYRETTSKSQQGDTGSVRRMAVRVALVASAPVGVPEAQDGTPTAATQ